MASIVSPAGAIPAKGSAWDRFQSYLRAVDRSQSDVSLSSLGVAVMALLAMAAAAYGAQATLAIVTGRHLYGDGSWFLLKMLSENHVAVWNVHGWHDFFVGRFGAFAYQEYPTLLAARLHVHNPKLLSLIYGVTLFSFKPISIWICYRFARDKRLVIFPVLTLFAITMNSEVYLVTETHLMSALFWPALFGLMYRRRFDSFDLAAMIVISAPLLVCYETMAMYGAILCAACVYRYLAVVESRREKWLCWAFFTWYALGAMLAVLAILFPRDVANREGFLKSMLFVFHNNHIGARVSCIVLVLCALIVLVPERYRTALNILAGIAVLCSIAIPAYIVMYPEATHFGTHVIARTMNAIAPLALAVGFVALHFHLLQVGTVKYKRLFVVAAVLGMCQSGWSLVASTQWSNMLTVLRAELRTHSGQVPFDDTVLSQYVVDGQPMRNLHADWPLMSLSILYSDKRKVHTILLPPKGGFQPFVPDSAQTLPNLKQFGFSYSPYLRALTPNRPYELGEWVALDEDGDTEARKIDGWWNSEPWGTWTKEEATVSFNLTPAPASDLLLQAEVGGLVTAKNPAVEATVLVNGVPSGTWDFHYKPEAPVYEMKELRLDRVALDKALPPVIEFRVTEARSPLELGLSGDPRKLGLAVHQIRLIAAPADGSRPPAR